MPLVDSHCHLNLIDFDALGEDLDAVLERAAERDVGHMLCVSVDTETFPEVLALACSHPRIFASAGIHPNTEVEREPEVEALVEMASAPEVVAIGETGLDYYRSTGELDWQRERLRRHVAAAKQTRKPLIIHTREASADTLAILGEEGADEVGGVFHCFAEDWTVARQALDLGFHISFSGIVTFKSAKALQEVARRVPAGRMLVETDAPWLAPVPFRGKTNQPAYVRYVAEHIAELRAASLGAIAERTTENFFRLFSRAHPAEA